MASTPGSLQIMPPCLKRRPTRSYRQVTFARERCEQVLLQRRLRHQDEHGHRRRLAHAMSAREATTRVTFARVLLSGCPPTMTIDRPTLTLDGVASVAEKFGSRLRGLRIPGRDHAVRANDG